MIYVLCVFPIIFHACAINHIGANLFVTFQKGFLCKCISNWVILWDWKVFGGVSSFSTAICSTNNGMSSCVDLTHMNVFGIEQTQAVETVAETVVAGRCCTHTQTCTADKRVNKINKSKMSNKQFYLRCVGRAILTPISGNQASKTGGKPKTLSRHASSASSAELTHIK